MKAFGRNAIFKIHPSVSFSSIFLSVLSAEIRWNGENIYALPLEAIHPLWMGAWNGFNIRNSAALGLSKLLEK